MTDLKQLAHTASENGMVRLEWVYRLIDLAIKETELRKVTENVHATKT